MSNIFNSANMTDLEKTTILNILNNPRFVEKHGSDMRCHYCQHCVFGICAKGIKDKNICHDLMMSKSLNAIDICKLCKYSFSRLLEDSYMGLYCEINMEDDVCMRIGQLSHPCNKFTSCLK